MGSSGGFKPLNEKSLVEYIRATPSLSSQLGNQLLDLQIKEVGDGNLNFVFIVISPSGSLVIKQVTSLTILFVNLVVTGYMFVWLLSFIGLICYLVF